MRPAVPCGARPAAAGGAQMLVHDLDGRRPVKRHVAGEQFIQHHAQAVDVGLRADEFRANLFRRDILRRANHSVELCLVFQIGVA